MDRRFALASSHRFFLDYQDEQVMPLVGLSAAEQHAYKTHIVPLLEAHGGGIAALARAVQRLVEAFAAQPVGEQRQALYEQCHRVADYVQSRLALVLVGAAAWLVSPDGESTASMLRRLAPAQYEVRAGGIRATPACQDSARVACACEWVSPQASRPLMHIMV